MKYFLTLCCAVFMALTSLPAQAVNPHEMLEDPALEERAREVSKNLRCVVCQNQSIDDSDADLARDMRVLVRDRIVAGDSNQEVLSYMVSRYGEFVLLKPPFNPMTYALWIGPLVIFIFGTVLVILYVRGRRATPSGAKAAQLSDDERRRIDELLKDER